MTYEREPDAPRHRRPDEGHAEIVERPMTTSSVERPPEPAPALPACVPAGPGGQPEWRTPDGRFAPGNPGKPLGARRRLTVAMEAILQKAAVPMTERAVELAREGQVGALRLCLDRLSPPRRDAPVEFDLPPVDGAEDAQRASTAILAAIAGGDLTPAEGRTIMSLLVAHKGIVEAGDHERRLAALERESGLEAP